MFNIGDLIIVNDCDRPSADLIAVVVAITRSNGRDGYTYCYINADRRLRHYRNMHGPLEEATKITDFGVELRHNDTYYWVVRVGESVAKYRDGVHRKWQEPVGPPSWRYEFYQPAKNVVISALQRRRHAIEALYKRWLEQMENNEITMLDALNEAFKLGQESVKAGPQ